MTRRIAHKLIFPLLAAGIIGTDAWLITITGRTGGFSTAFFVAQSLLFMLLLLLWLYNLMLRRPLKKLATGIDLLREQDFSSRVRYVGQEDADRIAGMFNEMMEHLKQERLHIREQNHFLDLVVEASPMGIVVLDNRGRITMANTSAARFLGAESREEIAGAALSGLDAPIARSCAALRPGQSEIVRLTDAKIFRCTCSSYMDKGYAHPFLTIEPLTEEMARAERAAYEKVIRMMAHEVNNSMAGVDSILDTACACIDDTELADALRACRRRCRSMSEFITAFAAVVKIPEADTVPTDINAFLSDSLPVLESICSGRGIGISAETAEEAPQAPVDTVLMEQVLINLVKNAAESIGDRGGSIKIRVTAAPAGFIVEDNGPGISPEAQTRIFTPFYSSKAGARGLGLLFAADVLRKHNCRFSLRTDRDGLTRFTVAFP